MPSGGNIFLPGDSYLRVGCDHLKNMRTLNGWRPTLGQVFLASFFGLTFLLGGLLFVVLESSKETISESSRRLRDQASEVVAGKVTQFLSGAPAVERQFQASVQSGLLNPRNPAELERELLLLLAANPGVGELSFTFADIVGYDDEGNILLANHPRGQVSTVRGQNEGEIWSQQVAEENGRFREHWRAHGVKDSGENEKESIVPDPTTHPTFSTPASKAYDGEILWSDLHWSQIDAGLPESKRRVEVSVQQSIRDVSRHFAGVLRVGLLAKEIEAAVGAPAGLGDAHQVFLCDPRGRLITRGVSSDVIREDDGDLRVPETVVPKELQEALRRASSTNLTAERMFESGRFSLNGREYLTTYRMLPDTQDWIIGIVVPESFYLGSLVEMRNRFLIICLAIMALILGMGALVLRAVQGANAQIVRESMKMNALEFAPAVAASQFRDVGEVLESLEKAKAGMRAMGKYAPLDLVRRLYHEKRDPVLGGETVEIAILFSDIKDFTTISEKLLADQLALALGRYLEAMGKIIQNETGGMIDKFIGDAIMALWNVPERLEGFAARACEEAIRCRDVGTQTGMTPAFVTRFGLHSGKAVVGHFGSPDRMNYTAIGDAVNLASRLEGLNKIYGTTIIASAHIRAEAGKTFEFRHLDRVAVKGKSEAIDIYELLGKTGDGGRTAVHDEYERAFCEYSEGKFEAAIKRLESLSDDAPSALLHERCVGYLQSPPADWNGVFRLFRK